MKPVAILILVAACTSSPPPPTYEHYALTRELVPTTKDETRAFAIDLNGDAVPDNQLGDVLASVHGLFGLDFQALADASGTTQQIELIWPAEIGDDAELVLDASDPLRMPTTRPPYVSAPGILTLQTTVLGSPLSLALAHARVRIRERTESGLRGSIGGGLTRQQVSDLVLPAFVTLVESVVSRDCSSSSTDCGCAPGSAGADWLSALDATHDCVITLDEVRANTAVQNLFAPDVRVDTIDLLSFAIDFEAVRER